MTIEVREKPDSHGSSIVHTYSELSGKLKINFTTVLQEYEMKIGWPLESITIKD